MRDADTADTAHSGHSHRAREPEHHAPPPPPAELSRARPARPRAAPRRGRSHCTPTRARSAALETFAKRPAFSPAPHAHICSRPLRLQRRRRRLRSTRPPRSRRRRPATRRTRRARPPVAHSPPQLIAHFSEGLLRLRRSPNVPRLTASHRRRPPASPPRRSATSTRRSSTTPRAWRLTRRTCPSSPTGPPSTLRWATSRSASRRAAARGRRRRRRAGGRPDLSLLRRWARAGGLLGCWGAEGPWRARVRAAGLRGGDREGPRGQGRLQGPRAASPSPLLRGACLPPRRAPRPHFLRCWPLAERDPGTLRPPALHPRHPSR